MSDLWDAISERLKTPYIGYTILAFIALNWRGIFLLIMTDGDAHAKLAAFDFETSYYHLYVFPFVIGAVVAASTQWVRFGFAWISRIPLEGLVNLRLEAEHKKKQYETKLEESLSDLFGLKEKDAIEKAKRDVEVSKIEDENTRVHLQAELDSLRREREQLSSQLKNINNKEKDLAVDLPSEALELIKAASQDRNGQIIKSDGYTRNIQAGTFTFGADSQRSFALYDAAVDKLVAVSLVKVIDRQGKIFELTHAGWEFADTL